MFRQWRKNNKARFKEVTYPHLKLLYNMALKYCGNTYDAEDLVQETMFAAYKNFKQLKDQSKSRGWLLVILRNIHIKEIGQGAKRAHLNQGSSYAQLLEGVVSGEIEIDFEKKLAARQVQMILDKLPEKYKTPLLLFFMEDFSYQEISDDLGVPIGTIMSRLARGKMYFKKELVKEMQSKNIKLNSKVIPMADFI